MRGLRKGLINMTDSRGRFRSEYHPRETIDRCARSNDAKKEDDERWESLCSFRSKLRD